MKNSILSRHFAPRHRFARSSRAFLFLLALVGALTTTATAAPALLGTQSSQYTNSNTLAFTVNAGTDRLLVVALGDPNTATNPTAVSYNSTPMLQANATADLGFSNDAIWYLKLGTGGTITSNIVVTFAAGGNGSSNRFIGASAYSGVDQTTPVDVNGPKISGSVTTTGSSLNVTSQTDDLVFDLFDTYRGASQATITTGAGQTRINDAGGAITPSGGFGHYVTSTEAGAPTVTMSWTADAEAVLHLTMNINAAPSDTTAPFPLSSNRQPLTTLAVSGSSTVFRVSFSESVTGVDVTDFSLFKVGTVNGTVASVTPVSGSTYDVTVNSITGFGSLRLDLKHSGTGIVDGASNALANGLDNGQVIRVGTTVPIGWGSHAAGQIADGTASGGNKLFPTAVDVSGVLSGKNIVQMASGANWTLALTADNLLYVWGSNAQGQYGNGTTTTPATVVPVAVPMTGVLSGKTIISIACGDNFSMALDSNGQIYSWGVGSTGQLGDGLNTTSSTPVAVSTSGALNGKVVTGIAGGTNFAVACTSDGGIYTWGRALNGRLGNGDDVTNVTTPAQLGGVFTGKRVVAVSGGGAFGAALTSDGRLYTWGNNTVGQLGDGGTLATPTSNATPAGILGTGLLPGSKPVANITCVNSGMYAIARDGTFYAWGGGTLGSLGNGGTTSSTTPVLVDTTGVLSGKTIAAINGGNNFAEVITTEGKAYSWGTNASGQLGDGTLTQRNNPIAVDVSASSALNGKTLSFLSQSGQGTFTMMAANAAAPAVAPTVTTAAQSAVTATSATLGGNVTADGGASVTERGIVWKTSTGPTTADNKVPNGSGTGIFSATVNSLPAGTTVFVRAYAINSVNTSYGNEISFTTLSPTVTLSASPTSIAEAAGVSTITATLSAAVSTSTTVTLTASGTATGSGTDYTLASTTITIAANQLTGTTTVTAVQDPTDEDDETVILDITGVSGGNGATENGSQQVTVTITDDDAVPSLSINDVSLTEGNSGSANLTFTVTLSPASGKSVTVNYATADGTASTGGTDYTSTSGTLTFTPGQTTQTINVPILGDTSVETNETFFVNLSGATNATISDSQGLGTISNDDLAADIPMTLTGGNLTINAGSAPGGAQIVLRFVAPNFLEIFDSTRTLGAPAGGTQVNSNTVRIPIASLTGGITLTGSASADVFTLDFSAGDICPPGGIAVNGGAPTTSPGDLLVIDGDFSSGGAYGTGAPGAGTLTLDTGNTVSFTGLEPVDMSAASFTDFTVTVDPGNLFSGNVITTVAAVDAGVNTNISFGASGLESAKLGTVTGTLTINGDNVEHDYFILQGLGSAMAGHFIVDGLGGDSDVIEINNTAITVAGVDKAVTLRADFVGVGRANQDLNTGVLNFKGPLTIEANGDFTVVTPLWGVGGVWGTSVPAYFPSSATMSARGNAIIKGELNKTGGADATVLIKATAGITTAGGNTVPVTTGGRIISTSNKANIILNADSDANSVGHVTVGLFSTLTSNGGDITIGGGANPATTPAFGFNAGGTLTQGVVLQSCSITSGGGAISVRGSGFAASGGHGIFCVSGNSANVAISSGSGNITMNGTSGALTGLHGITQQNSATTDTVISSTTGAISLSGTASLANSDGIRLVGRTSITGTGVAPISLTGTGAGTGLGIQLNPTTGLTTSVSSAGGNITLIADKMALGAGAGTENIATSGTGSVTLKPLTAAVAIDLGSAVDTTASTLELGSTELDTITASTLAIGDSSSGAISVSSVIAPLGFKTLALARNTTFSATGGFTSDVTSASVFEKVTVTGTIDLVAGVSLSLASAGGYVWNGTDAFTILDNDSTDAITGIFTPPPTLTNFLGSSLTAQQSYTGGTGNDLVFSAPPSANADLATLTTTAGALSPVFVAGTTLYSTANVPNATSSVTVTATRAQANATLAVQVNGGGFNPLTSGTASGALALNVGGNTIQVRVTAQDTTTTKIYTINVTRSAPPGAPTITSVAPARAPIVGGSTVIITGTDFTGATGVNFGSTAATSFTVNSPTQITATVPAGSAGILDLSVVTGLGTGTGSGLFYYFTTSGSTPAVAASKVDIFTPNGAGKVLPGAPIQYRTLIANTGNGNATTVDFADAIPANTALVPGSVNVSPLAEDDSYATIVNTQLAAGGAAPISGPVVTAAAKVTANDREFLTDTFTISASDSASANGGSVIMFPDGSFTYVPPAGFTGVDSFTYTIRDDGTDSTAGNSDDLTGTGIVTITVNDANTGLAGVQKVWYIDGSYAGANGAENGTSARPFNALSDVSGGGPDLAGDTLYLAAGAYTGGITLLADQSLIGANEALVLNSVTLAAAGIDPVITNVGSAGVTLATGNTLRGFTIGDAGVDISGTAAGNLTISNVNCSGQGGFLSISTSAALAVTIDSAVSTASVNAVSLIGTTGTCTFTGGSIAGATGDDFVVSGGTAVISYGGTITNSTGRSVNVASKTGGSVTFSGAITDTAGSTGISLTSNSGSTINFSGGLSLTTTSNAAFTATGGGTVNVTGATNTLTTTTATALNVANTTIGASGLTFQSITAGTASGTAGVGISLDTTGSSGGLTVTGTGSAGSGGTIQRKTGANLSRTGGIGIYLNNTANVSLTRMQLNDFDNFAVRGFGVSGFTLANCVINGVNGNSTANLGGTDEQGEGSVYFGNAGVTNSDGLNGTVIITNSTIQGGSARNLSIADTASTSVMRATISGCTFGLTQNLPGGNQSLAVEARNAGTTSHVSVSNSTFTGSMSDAMNFTGQTGTTMHVIVGGAGVGNTITNTHPGNNIGSGSIVFASQGIMFFDARNNTMSGANGSAVTIFKANAGTQMEGTFDSNVIGTNGVADSGSATGNGIFLSASGAGAIKLAITNNIIQRYSGNAGIYADNTDGSYTVDMTVTGNTLRQPGAGVFAGLAVTNGSPSSADTTNVFLRALNNNFADGDPNNANDIIVGASGSAAGTHTFTLSGATAGDVASEAAIEAFLKTNNNLAGAAAATVVDAYVDAPVTFSAFKASVSLPAAPGAPLPLLFAETEPGTPDLTPASKTASEAKTAALTSQTAPKPVLAEKALTNENLQKLVLEAKARWIASGLTSEQKAALEALRIEISDLNELHLGQAAGDLIQISRTAAGNAWFVDETPSDDAEFERRTGFQPVSSDNGLKVRSTVEGVDLLTTLMHEMGHRLGLPDTYALRDRSSIMYGYLTRGERRLPAPNQARGAVLSTDETQRFLGATINIGTLPAGKSVTIVGTVLVNDPANTQLISSQGTVSGGNFTSVLTDDPAFAGTTNPTTTPVERPDAAVVSINRVGATPTNAASVSWTVTFDQPVSGLSTSHFSVAISGVSGAAIISLVNPNAPAASTTWNFNLNTGTGSGTLGLNMANDSGALSHDVTNLPFTGQVYTIDKSAPVFSSIVRQTPTAQDTNADTLVFRATFNEPVTGVSTADFAVTGTTGSITGVSAVSTSQYDITVSGGNLASLNGTVGIDLAFEQNITDLAGNALPATEPATDQTYNVDNAAPTVTLASTTLNPAPNAVIPVTVTFNESVTGFDLTDITVAGGSKGNFAGTGAIYTFDLTPSGPGVTVTADVAASAAQDAAGNNNSAATQFTRSIVDAVSITATTATAAEGGATGLYTFTRGASSGALTVSFQLDGSSTATAATDFTLTSSGTLTFTTGTGAGTLVIPNGQLSATVTLTALAEIVNAAEAAETARLNVVAGSGYVAGSPANATVTITENSFLVTTTADSGTGSLRQAVDNANSIAGTDTITFSDGTGGTVNFTDASADTILLSGGQLSLTSSLTIAGPGANLLILQNTAPASSTSRVIRVTGSSIAVRLSGLTLTGGNATSAGGGMTISASGSTVDVMGCAIVGNSTTISSGGIRQILGSLTVVNSTISGNTSTGTTTGGGIESSGTALTLINSTVSGNSVTGSSANNGGGISTEVTTTTIRNCTITNNSGAGGISGMRTGGGTVTVSNSIIAGNVSNITQPDIGGTFTSSGGNLIGNSGTATGFTNGVNNDQVGNGASPINPQLAALANNGGLTQTHVLNANSTALNAGLIAQIPADTFDLDGDTNVAEPLPFDQRGTGFIRAIGTVDIGAFELQKSVSIGNLAAISEGNSGTTNFVFTITRTGDTTGDVNMTYTVSGAAVNGTDFVGGTLPTGTATITAGNATTTVTIPVSGDTTVEPNEAFTVTLSAPDNGYVISGAPATSTINNDDAATVSITKITDGAEANAPTNGKFRVTQTAASSTDTTVAYTVTGTATSGTDFTALSGSVTIPAGSTTADIDVTVLNEGTTLEPTETVILTVNTVTSVNNVTLGSPATATMNLTDDDTATVTIAKITDGAETPTSALFRVTQTAQATVDTVITYTTGGTATSGSDYTAPSGSVTILAGQTTADVAVAITNDAIVEATETLSLTLTGFTARDADVSLGSPVIAFAGVNDNDSATVSIAKVNDGAETNTPVGALFRVTQTAQSSADTTVTYSFSGSASSGTDFTALSGSVTIPAGETTADISVTVLNDNIVEATESITVTLTGFSARDADIALSSTPSATAAIVDVTDNDMATVSIAKLTDGVEAAVPTNASFRLTQSAASSTATIIAYNVGGTASSGTDFTALSGSVTIPAGQTTADITVPVLDENMVEPTETVSVTLTSITSGDTDITLLVPLSASADITDSDTSVITLAAVSADKDEGTGGGTTAFTFSATLSNPVQGGFTLAYTTNDDSALAGSDYTDNDSSLSFSGAAESQTITVLVTHDGTNEIDETFTVALGAITGTTLGGALSIAESPQTGTILNDDALTITIAATDADADENTAATGSYRITRNGVLGATTVQLAVDASSSAVAADWTQSGATFASLAPGSNGTAVIADGDTFVDITLTPSSDLHAEADETIRINVTADAAYVIGSPADATVTIGQNDFLVINTNDAGEGTLRQAVLNANAIAGDDTITFDATAFATAQTITLTSGEIVISSNAIVQGTGLITLNGNAASRIFHISGATAILSDLTLTNGSHATSWGGALNVVNASVVTLERCTVSNSTSALQGGGIYVNNGTLNVVSSTISGNTATTVGGGAIATGTSVANATVNVTNSTISGNMGTNGGAMLFGSNAVVSLLHTTVTNNTSAQGPNVWSGGGAVTVANSLIAANQINTGHADVGGAFTSNGGNLIGDGGPATGFTHGTNNDQVGNGAAPINPLLGPLQDNGGPTLTHMILNGSPAINAGLVANLPIDTNDQRGYPNLRQRGPAPDAGAIEAFAFEPTLTVATTDEDVQSTSGLVITANTADGGLTTHYQITSILNGTLYQNDGTTTISANSFITKAEGLAGLKFLPDTNKNDPNTATGFGFTAQAAISAAEADLRGETVDVEITVNPVADTPTVTGTFTVTSTQSTDGLVIARNAVDSTEVTHFKITGIQNGVLYKNDGTTTIAANSFITVAEGSAGLKFTPAGGFVGSTSFTVQGAVDNSGTGLSPTVPAEINVGYPAPRITVLGPLVLNRKTGLYEHTVRITNAYVVPMDGFRLTNTNLLPEVQMWNRTHAYLPVIEDSIDLGAFSSRDVLVQYYSRERDIIEWEPTYSTDNLTDPEIAVLPPDLSGLWHGLAGRSTRPIFSPNPAVGARLEVNVSTSGLLSGKVTEGKTVKPFTARISGYVNLGDAFGGLLESQLGQSNLNVPIPGGDVTALLAPYALTVIKGKTPAQDVYLAVIFIPEVNLMLGVMGGPEVQAVVDGLLGGLDGGNTRQGNIAELDDSGDEVQTLLNLPFSIFLGWRNIWGMPIEGDRRAGPASPVATYQPTPYLARHHFAMAPVEVPNLGGIGTLNTLQALNVPEGFSFGTLVPLNVAKKRGDYTVAGRLADGTSFTCSSFYGQYGQCLVHQSLYGDRGSLLGLLLIIPGEEIVDNDILGILTWLKPGPLGTAKLGRNYGRGFSLFMEAQGGTYTPPAKGKILMGLSPTLKGVPNALMSFDGAGLTSSLNQPVRAASSGLASLVNTLIPTLPNASAIRITSFSAATGLIKGSLTTAIVPKRAATFEALIVPTANAELPDLEENDIIQAPVREQTGFGYFLLPQVPVAPQTTVTSPILSGRVYLTPNDN